MPAQIKQNVNFIIANEFGNLRVGQAVDVAPKVGGALEMFGDAVNLACERITANLKNISVKVVEQIPAPRHDDVPLKIGGHEAHANFIVRIKFPSVRFDVRRKFFVVVIKFTEVLGRKIFGTVGGKERVADFIAGFFAVIFKFGRQAKTFDSLGRQAQFAIDGTEETCCVRRQNFFVGICQVELRQKIFQHGEFLKIFVPVAVNVRLKQKRFFPLRKNGLHVTKNF